MIVKVAPIGEIVKEVSVDEGSTVGNILTIAGISLNDRTITVNNAPVSLDSTVTTEGSVIALVGKMKGGVRS
jgi:hypothetical protein